MVSVCVTYTGCNKQHPLAISSLVRSGLVTSKQDLELILFYLQPCNMKLLLSVKIPQILRQAGAELCQAQLQLSFIKLHHSK